MSILKQLRGQEVFPSVKDILATATKAETAGNFGKITTKTMVDDKPVEAEYYYLLDSEDAIGLDSTKFKVVKSIKHDALFIVPNTPNGFTKF